MEKRTQSDACACVWNDKETTLTTPRGVALVRLTPKLHLNPYRAAVRQFVKTLIKGANLAVTILKKFKDGLACIVDKLSYLVNPSKPKNVRETQFAKTPS